MSSSVVDYELLMEQFLRGAMPVEEIQTTYLNRFKNEGQLDDPLFELLDELCGDGDSFTTDPQLLAGDPSFYVDETSLREKVRQVAVRLWACNPCSICRAAVWNVLQRAMYRFESLEWTNDES